MEALTGISTAETVGRQVRIVLAEQGRQQAELAALLRLTGAALSRRTLGQVAFRVDELAQVADYLGVEPARFFRPLPEARTRDQPKAVRTTRSAGAAA